MNAETTVANNGRSMKKFEITARCPARYCVRCRVSDRHRVDGRSGLDLQDAVDDDARAGREPRRHRDVVARSAPSSTGAGTGWPLPSTVQTYAPCAPCMTARFGITSEFAMLTPSMRARTIRPGTTPRRVVENGADRDRARSVVDARRDELDRAHLRDRVPLRVRDADADAVGADRFRGPRARGPHRCRRRQDRRTSRSACTMYVSRLESVPAVTRLPSERTSRLVMPPIGARTSVYESSSSAVRNAARAAATAASRALERRERRIAIAQARELLLVERQDSVALAARLAEIRLLHASAARARAACGAKRLGIDAEQQVAGLDARAFVVAALEQDARHARAHLDLAHAFQLRRVLEHERQRARLDVDDAHLDGRERRRRRGRPAARGEHERRRQREKAETAPRASGDFVVLARDRLPSGTDGAGILLRPDGGGRGRRPKRHRQHCQL